eukprot:6981522-Pyramimonas_sp.AAC.1
MYGHAADPEGFRAGLTLVHGLPPVQLMRGMFLAERWRAGWCGKEYLIHQWDMAPSAVKYVLDRCGPHVCPSPGARPLAAPPG